MNATTREPQATESYATFWEPLAPNAPPAPAVAAPAEAKAAVAPDAYQEFTELTEGVPAARREPV